MSQTSTFIEFIYPEPRDPHNLKKENEKKKTLWQPINNEVLQWARINARTLGQTEAYLETHFHMQGHRTILKSTRLPI